MLTPFNPAYKSMPLPANKYELGPDDDGDASPVCRCSECGEGIFYDDHVWVFGEKLFCEACTDRHRATAGRWPDLSEDAVIQRNIQDERDLQQAYERAVNYFEASR